MVRRAIIMGAAGRDFHNFNTFFRDNPEYEVVAFTAAQVPHIGDRIYPPSLSGDRYPRGIPIYPEDELEDLIKRFDVTDIFFSYSDVSHEYVMHQASRALASGANFTLLGPRETMLEAKRPVIAVCAVRTGSGKSPLSRWIASMIQGLGVKIVVLRHPMPYGELSDEVQRYGGLEDLDRYHCTWEEREDYEPHLKRGIKVFAGVDYGRVLGEAEEEADILLWDGGNNDLPFIKPTIHLVAVDPHRAGHELSYHPGEANLRMADIVVITKVDTAPPGKVEAVEANIRRVNSKAEMVRMRMPITLEGEEELKGKKVLVIEDGPTLTHGGMAYGAATFKAQSLGLTIIDPRPYATGSLKKIYQRYGHIGPVLPAIGYSREEMEDLQETINRTPCDAVLAGTPADIGRYLEVDKPFYRIGYEVEEVVPGELRAAILERLKPFLEGIKGL